MGETHTYLVIIFQVNGNRCIKMNLTAAFDYIVKDSIYQTDLGTLYAAEIFVALLAA